MQCILVDRGPLGFECIFLNELRFGNNNHYVKIPRVTR